MEKQNGNMQKEGVGANVLVLGHKCHRCNHKWIPREEGYIPEICPSCKSPYWKSPRIRKAKAVKKK